MSTHDRRCDRQKDELTIYADRCGYDMVQIYRETGSGAKLDRVEQKRVIIISSDY